MAFGRAGLREPAAQRSGALITASFANDQGKQVFAIPGPIDSERHVGCHALIKQGAKLVTEIEDIFEEFYEEKQEVAPAEIKTMTTSTSLDTISRRETTRDERHGEEEIPAAPLLAHLETTCSIDELHNKTGLSLRELQNQLFSLQLEGKVKQTFSGLWEKVF